MAEMEKEGVVKVGLGVRSYAIRVGAAAERRLVERVAELKAAGVTRVVLTDKNVESVHGAWLERVFPGVPRHLLAPGEASKRMKVLEGACDFFLENGMDRQSVVFAVGGGVVGDLAGFAAAVYMRGIGCFQVPTTLLAMVDSSVGGKTGINLTGGKNLVGAFLQPKEVFAVTGLLQTLPRREFAAGMAEVIKHGMLADRSLFEELETASPFAAGDPGLDRLVLRNCVIKAGVVEADEREMAGTGGRALLNLGHTFGHAIEAVAGYGDYLHGEAVAIGLVLATRLSVRLGYLGEGEVFRVRELLERYQLPVALRKRLETEDLLSAMKGDKKNRRGRLRLVLLRSLGEAMTRDDVPDHVIRDLWREGGAG